MKAIVYTEYGSPDVLHLTEVAKPAPKDNEVLIRIHATPVNFGDLLARNFKSCHAAPVQHAVLLLAPRANCVRASASRRKIFSGNEFAGEVEAVGAAVTRFKPGRSRSLAIAVRAWALTPNICACPKTECWRSNRPI